MQVVDKSCSEGFYSGGELGWGLVEMAKLHLASKRTNAAARVASFVVYIYSHCPMIHENLQQSIEDLTARILTIRDSL